MFSLHTQKKKKGGKQKNAPNISIVFLKGREHLINIKLVRIQVESRFNIGIKSSFIGGYSHILAGLQCAYFHSGDTKGIL